MCQYARLFTNRYLLLNKEVRRNVSLRHIKKTPAHLRKVTRNIDIALEHFDGLYSKVYNKQWPSMRLGLLSPRKYCAILNSFVDEHELPEGSIDLQAFYEKRLKMIDKANKKRTEGSPVEVQDSINPTSASDREDETDHGSAEDLLGMFNETRLDDEDRPFVNRASTNISLDDYVPTSELIFHENLPNDPVLYDGTIREVDKNIQILDHPPIVFQEHLKVNLFPRGDLTRFEQPQKVAGADIFPYYLLDGASILPVLVLNVNFDDICADYCAAPGGKSLALIMTLKPKYLLCNDSSQNRLSRLHNIIKLYIPEISYVKSMLNFSNRDARKLVYPDTFDKILVDVPCTNDRNAVESMDNNIFKRTRSEERLNLPSNQCDILKSALKSLKPNGELVYSTCTLSPVENDNVVKRSLLQLREEGFPANYAVMNLKQAFQPFRRLFAINTQFTYGQQVVPSICSNFGPMYISKLKRIP